VLLSYSNPVAAEPARTLTAVSRFIGQMIYVTVSGGNEFAARLIDVTANEIIVEAAGVQSSVPASEVRQISIRGDSLKNGAAIGVGAGLLAALLSPFKGESPGCKHPCILWSAVAIGILASAGAFVDWRHEGQTVIYEAP
jgi:hypothetical protein